jgi:hypothetical protein
MIADKRILKELHKHNIKFTKLEKKEDNSWELHYKQIKFIIPCDYPFKIPFLYVKGNKYIQMLNNATYLLNKKECLCCISILCPNNWSPIHNIKDIINEYNNIAKQMILSKNLKVFKFKILKKYNLEDIFGIIEKFLISK